MLFASPAILFVRGAVRSGGFLEGTDAATRNEQLADINNTSTAARNAGWGTFAQTLRDAGYAVEQIAEAKEPNAPPTGLIDGRPIHFENLDLSKYAAVVFGSNNARYSRASVDAIETYIRGGGSALFISDANFGSNWRDAVDSDQQFFSRFGITVQQDNATVTTLSLAAGDFATANHPVLFGVDAIEGEGVSPLVVPATPPPGVSIARIVAAKGQTRNNDGVDPANDFAGSLRATNDHDASLVLANADRGRVAGFFDRNTFFNPNGLGTDITKHDNRQLALNIFKWLTDQTPPALATATFTQGVPSELHLTFNDSLYGSLTRGDVLLRNAIDATPIPRDRWSFILTESADETDLLIRIKSSQPPDLYQFQINPNRLRDDSGNLNPKRIRFNFRIV